MWGSCLVASVGGGGDKGKRDDIESMKSDTRPRAEFARSVRFNSYTRFGV